MYAQFFGNYLLSKKVVTTEQLIQAIQKKASKHTKLGTLAIHAGNMTANEVDSVIIIQTPEDKRFGDLAVREGYLTEKQVAELIQDQGADFLSLGQVLLDDGIINNEQLQDLILGYESENEFNDFDYSDETKENVDHLIENFFTTTERTLSTHELSFLQLLFTNLIRFVGDDFMPAAPYLGREYPTNYCVSQRINGPFSARLFMDMTEPICIAFASRYVGDTFTDFDEYVQSSCEDFLNLHNGLFCVNLSNSDSIELALDPPVVETDELLTFNAETYLLPVTYDFGTIHFILEIYKA